LEFEEIPDPEGCNIEKPLTAIPSPFARMHIFETAFHMVNNLEHEGSSYYHKLVSECLDVFEMVFNINDYKISGENIKIDLWNKEKRIEKLISSGRDRHKLIGEAFKMFFDQDGETSHYNSFKDFSLIFVNGKLIAGTSPLTIFFTTPDPINIDLKNPNGDPYFKKIIPLHKRSLDFQLYIHTLFIYYQVFAVNARQVWDYLNKSKNLSENPYSNKVNDIYQIKKKIRDTYEDNYSELHTENKLFIYNERIRVKKVEGGISSDLIIDAPKSISEPKPLVLQNGLRAPDLEYCNGKMWDQEIKVPLKDPEPDLNKRKLPGLDKLYPYLTVADFLEDAIFKVNFPINRERFISVHNDKEKKQCDFLIPLTKLFFKYFYVNDVKKYLEIKILEKENIAGLIKVTLKIPIKKNRFIHFIKYYDETKSIEKENGDILKTEFNLAIFPFLRVTNKDFVNHYYNIMILDKKSDLSQGYRIEFYEENDKIPVLNEGTRTKKTTFQPGTKYHELNKTFNLVEIYDSESKSSNFIIPNWEDKYITIGDKQFTCAIDLGTTNTYIAYSIDNSDPLRFDITRKDIQAVLLNQPNFENTLADYKVYEDFNHIKLDKEIVGLMISKQKREFVPCIIGGYNPKYKFPIRTVTCEGENFSKTHSNLFIDFNIPFVYEKEVIGDENINTNIKWQESDDMFDRDRLKFYIKEVLILLRNKILLNKGALESTKIIWFYPMSWVPDTISYMEQTWEELTKSIFSQNVVMNNLTKLSESEAPYYYHSYLANVTSANPLINIDIGGGSTDISIILDNEPKYGLSFKYGGNSVYGNGYDKSQKINNGIPIKYKGTIKQLISRITDEDIKKNLQSLFEFYYNKANQIRSEEIINFCFHNDEYLEFSDEFRSNSNPYKILLLLFYGSIIYFLAKVFKLLKLQFPEFICFSGNMSNSIKIIDKNPKSKGLGKFTSLLFSKVVGIDTSKEISIITAAQPKEATCMGGITKIGKGVTFEAQQVIYYGDKDFNFTSSVEKLLYRDIKEDKLRLSVIENVKDFIKEFIELDSKLNFMDMFGINNNVKQIANSLVAKLEKSYDLGILRRLGMSKNIENVSVNETLFFYPLIHSIYELTKEI
jgi:hypothetical protein